jgi:hypothetical protein
VSSEVESGGEDVLNAGLVQADIAASARAAAAQPMGDGAFDAGAGGVVPPPMAGFLELASSANRLKLLTQGQREFAWLGFRTAASRPHWADGAVVASKKTFTR